MSICDEFVSELKLRGYSADTIANHRSNIRLLSDWLGRGFDLSGITPSLMREYLGSLDCKASTMVTKINLYKTFFSWAEENGYVVANPCLKIKAPPARRIMKRLLTKDELKALFAACRLNEERCLLGLGFYAGLRAVEMARLECEHIGKESLEVVGKGNKNRIVPIADTLLGWLEARVEDVGGSGPLFTSRSGLKNRIRRVGERAGVRVGSHDLRHAFATYSLRVGDLRSVMALLGHSQLRSTEVYLHSDPEQTRNVVKYHDLAFNE